MRGPQRSRPAPRRRAAGVLVVVLAGSALGCGRAAVDVPHLVADRGLDGAAEALTLRLARAPHDRGLHAALAAIEDRRGRPGAAHDHLADRSAAASTPATVRA